MLTGSRYFFSSLRRGEREEEDFFSTLQSRVEGKSRSRAVNASLVRKDFLALAKPFLPSPGFGDC